MMASSCTSVERANGRVLAVAGDVVEQVAQRERGGVNGAGQSTTWPSGSATLSAHALACTCTSGRLWAWRVLVPVVHEFVEQGVQQAQVSEMGRVDTVVHAGKVQRERECVHVHGRVIIDMARGVLVHHLLSWSRDLV